MMWPLLNNQIVQFRCVYTNQGLTAMGAASI